MTAAAVSSSTAGWAARLTASPRVFCFLDYDGTLAPIAPTPDEAVPLPGTKELVSALAAAPGTAVAIVTGRTIADVRRFLDVPTAYYVGVHGAENSPPGGTVTIAAETALVRDALVEIRAALRAAFATVPGILIEDKGVALACHYRRAARPDAQRLRTAVAALVDNQRRGGAPIDVIEGHQVVELRTPGINKGIAVCRLLAQTGPALAVYIGDDITDEEAFVRLPADAVTVRVGAPSIRTRGAYRVEDPAAAQRFLHEVLACRHRHSDAAAYGG